MTIPSKNKHYLLYGFLVVFIIFLLGLSGRLGNDIEEVTDTVTNTVTEAVINAVNTDATKIHSPQESEYIVVTDSCNERYEGGCVNVRSGPSLDAKTVFQARNGIILKVDKKITNGDQEWYKIKFDEWLRYPERVRGDLYISADFVSSFMNEGLLELSSTTATTTKYILVDRSDQILYAYDGNVLFMQEKVSTGIEITPTPRGTFTIFKKTPSRYMQGPIPGISTHPYDLPGVPWNLYFTEQGAVIHGAYWHNNFGNRQSNGCVNLPIASAEKLYKWAEIGTKVIVRD